MIRELKPLQQQGVDHLCKVSPKSPQGRRCLFADMGTGKTPMSSAVAAQLDCRRILILCKDSGVNVWRYDGKAWLEQFMEEEVHLHFLDEEPWNRELEWNTFPTTNQIHVYICIYNTFANDMGVISKRGGPKRQDKLFQKRINKPKIIGKHVKFDLIILDECKRVRDRRSAAYLGVRKFLNENGATYILPMSGTPGHWPPHYWTYFNLIDRKKFSSYWQFVQHFMVIDDGPFGQEILEQRHDTKEEWDRLINEYCYVIPTGVMKPPVERQMVIYDLESVQKGLVEDLQKDMLALSEDTVLFAQNAMVQFLRLRQLLICPKILGETLPYGGAIKYLVDIFKDNPKESHTVIFTPFTDSFIHFKTCLGESGFKDVFTLSGGITSKEQQDRIEAYRRTKGIIICSVKYAEAFSLEPAKKCWFIGYDEDPDTNRQAEGRLSRLSSSSDVMANYLTANTPNDIRMAEIVAIKQERVNFALPENLKQLWSVK